MSLIIQDQYIGQNSLLVTSRFSGLDEARGLKFRAEIPIFVVQDFKLEDVETFLHNWCWNIEIAEFGTKGNSKSIIERKKQYEALIAIIKDKRYKNLRELAVNPLLLTIIAIVHRARSIIPRERHKLYETCLNVMITLWNLSYRMVGVSFSFENSMGVLSKIANIMMLKNCREMDKKIVISLLPNKIEGQTGDFFLKEMVLKAGLLYESEGKYGFMHFTFQEYLAAYHFARSRIQNSIIKCRDNSSWIETFKLFVNIGNAELFFEEIINNFLDQGYWKQIKLWEDCLSEVAVEEKKKTIELRFARKIIDILLVIEYKENEKLVEELSLHYPLFKNPKDLRDNAWELFYKAKHPFVKSIGTSILYRADKKTQDKLMKKLRFQVDEFEKSANKNQDALCEYLLENNNTFLLHVGRRKLSDFYFVLSKLKSDNSFLQYLVLRDFRDIRFIRSLRSLVDFRLLKDFLGLRFFQDLRLLRELLDLQGLRLFLELFEKIELKPLLDSVALGGLLDIRILLDILTLRDLRFFISLQYFPVILEEYEKKYKAIIMRHQGDIIQWAEHAIEKLYNMPNSQLKKYFPKSTDAEIKRFRDSYTGSIADELSRGNSEILKGKILTKEVQARVEKLVDFDFDTVGRMLDFELDTPHDRGEDSHHLKALKILENHDYEKLREIIERFKEDYDNERIRDNAIEIFKI